jgi:CDP-diacylglycerol--serine O-phosphatidyltransferase
VWLVDGRGEGSMAGSRHLRRGIYLIPTLFTVGHLFCGYASIVLSSTGVVTQAALMIVLAGVLDGLDGRLARLTGTSTDFGVQFDSLADIVSFGVAPAILMFNWMLYPLGRVGWTVAFIMVVCTAMRLARFNIQTGRGDKKFFAGLPSPAAAGILACIAFAVPSDPLVSPARWQVIATASLLIVVALLMVSRVRYRSFKDFDLRNRRSYIYILPLAAMLIAIAVNPRVSLLLFAVLYVLSAPVAYVYNGVRRQFAPRSDSSPESEVLDGPASR